MITTQKVAWKSTFEAKGADMGSCYYDFHWNYDADISLVETKVMPCSGHATSAMLIIGLIFIFELSARKVVVMGLAYFVSLSSIVCRDNERKPHKLFA